MSKRASPTVVGAFVLGAIAFLILAIVVFGSGTLFSSRPRAVAFFQGSVQGLNVGAPVNLRGVPIGSVTAIKISVDMRDMTPMIATYLEFDPDRIKFEHTTAADFVEHGGWKRAISAGLHARLASQSLVTGQLLVELDLSPNEPTRLAGADPSTIEIPTSPSDMQKLKEVLSRVPVEEIAGATLRTLNDIDHVVTSPEVPRLLQSFASSADSLNGLITLARGDFGPLATNLQAALADLQTSLKTATNSLQRIDKVVTDVGGLVGTNSVQRHDIDQSLNNLNATMRSLRSFADELERKPNSIVMGK